MFPQTTYQLRDRLSLTPVCECDERNISGGYAGDLLSWVMGRCPEDAVWVTVMSNVNVVAVAQLAGAACVIIAEGAELIPEALEKAKQNGINIYQSDKPVFELCRLI